MHLLKFCLCGIESSADCLITIIHTTVLSISAGITGHSTVRLIKEHFTCTCSWPTSCINHWNMILIRQFVTDITCMSIVRAAQNNRVLPDNLIQRSRIYMLYQFPECIYLTVRIDICSAFPKTVHLITSHIMDSAHMSSHIVISHNIIICDYYGTDTSSHKVHTNFKTSRSSSCNNRLF